MTPIGRQLMDIYQALLAHYGPQGWWPPGNTQEVVIGCILVQHTTWKQVERALAALRARNLMDFAALHKTPQAALAEIIRPAGTPKVKSKRLKTFSAWLGEHCDFSLETLLSRPQDRLRSDLLSIQGIGLETADCIILYAAEQPTFVVDTYTHRIMSRHGIAGEDWSYHDLKSLFHAHLPEDVPLLNEYHALLVAVGKGHCRKSPLCEGCPLEHLEHHV